MHFGATAVVDEVSLTIDGGEKFALVGESGSGKSITALSVLGLVDGADTSGRIVFDGQDLRANSEPQMRAIRGGEIAMIFQEPMTALNPLHTIGAQIGEVLRLHEGVGRGEARARAIALLDRTGIPEPARRVDAWPHQLSGGQRQRAMIAMALACRPRLLIADEPTTALDVTIQAQVLDLIQTQQRERFMSVVLVTHDLGVVARIADQVAVMYAGQVVEQGAAEDIFATPRHPYTRGLLRSVPDPTDEQGKLYQIPGLPPDLAHLPPGCPFAPRCERAEEICRREFPPYVQLTAGHYSLCHFAHEVFAESADQS